jgi:hypothetical protein
MLVAARAFEHGMGNSDSYRIAAIRVLALSFLGMDGRSGGVRVSLRTGFIDAGAPRKMTQASAG